MSRIVDLKALEFRLITSLDLPEVCAIESRVYPDPWSPELLKESLSAPLTHCLAALVDAKIAAYAIYQVIFTEAHLLNIAVHPDFQNKGIGRELLRTVMTRSRESGGISFFLEVRPTNDIALKLYQKEGFRNLMIREKILFERRRRGRHDGRSFRMMNFLIEAPKPRSLIEVRIVQNRPVAKHQWALTVKAEVNDLPRVFARAVLYAVSSRSYRPAQCPTVRHC